MESSESTPSIPGEPSIWLGLIVRGDDRSKACTGRRLLEWQKVHRWAPGSGRIRRLLLDPHAPEILSRSDDEVARAGGVVVVDCSWNRLAHRTAALDDDGASGARLLRRRLPLLIAANPQHFGRLAELNTVEAFAAALYLVGAPGRAAQILGGFRGGTTFLTLNRERLDAYRAAATPEQVRSAEQRLFGGPVTPSTGPPVRAGAAVRRSGRSGAPEGAPGRPARPRSRQNTGSCGGSGTGRERPAVR